MSSNPFQSPSLAARELDFQQPVQHKRHPLLVIFVGVCLGSMIGGFTGTVTAGSLGLTAGLVLQYQPSESDSFVPPHPLELMAFTGTLGGFFGLVGGAPLGLLMGIVATLLPYRWRLALSLPPTFLAGLFGVGMGAIGGALIVELFSASRLVWPVLGAVIGLAGGLFGGWLLSRCLGRFVWGRRPAPEQPIVEATAAP